MPEWKLSMDRRGLASLQTGDEEFALPRHHPICAMVALQLQAGLDGFLAIGKHLLVKRGVFPPPAGGRRTTGILDAETAAESIGCSTTAELFSGRIRARRIRVGACAKARSYTLRKIFVEAIRFPNGSITSIHFVFHGAISMRAWYLYFFRVSSACSDVRCPSFART